MCRDDLRLGTGTIATSELCSVRRCVVRAPSPRSENPKCENPASRVVRSTFDFSSTLDTFSHFGRPFVTRTRDAPQSHASHDRRDEHMQHTLSTHYGVRQRQTRKHKNTAEHQAITHQHHHCRTSMCALRPRSDAIRLESCPNATPFTHRAAHPAGCERARAADDRASGGSRAMASH